jgi:hypothetical protein
MVDGTHVVISCGAADHTVVVWDLESSSKRNSILIDELEHAKNVRERGVLLVIEQRARLTAWVERIKRSRYPQQ